MKAIANRFTLLRQERLRLLVAKLAAQPSRLTISRTAQPISALGLTTRAANCLKAESIETIGQLLEWTRTDLHKTPNCGRRTIQEIEDELAKIGLHLKGRTS